MSGAQCWDAIRNTRQNRPTLPNWRLPWCRYGTIFRRSSWQSSHFERLRSCVAAGLQLVDIVNTRFKYREGSWHLSLKRLNWWRKVVQTDSLYWIFRTGLLFTCKSEFSSLNCCIYWITSVFVMKFAAYVAWILLYKRCKFGKKICNNFRYRIFPRGLFFGAPCILVLCRPNGSFHFTR